MYETVNNDNGSLLVGTIAVSVGDLIEIVGEGKVRRVTYVMGAGLRTHICFRGQGAVPLGPVRWRFVHPQTSVDRKPKASETEAQCGDAVTNTTAAFCMEFIPLHDWGQIAQDVRQTVPNGGKMIIAGFDSAWTQRNAGGFVAVEISDRGISILEEPVSCGFDHVADAVAKFKREGFSVMISLDQPLIVPNETGRRPVEASVAPMIGRCGGGVQPANRSRTGMFDDDAPIWRFLEKVTDGNPNMIEPGRAHRLRAGEVSVVEVYPAMAILGMFGGDARLSRLPKYNPERKTFRIEDWRMLSSALAGICKSAGLIDAAAWCKQAAAVQSVRKALQDQLDSVICALVGLAWMGGGNKTCLTVGDTSSGYIVSPAHESLVREIRQDAVIVNVPVVWIS